MREILFRGKHTDCDQWLFGFYYRMDETTYCFAEDYERNPVPRHHYIFWEEMTDWGLPNRLVQGDVFPETVGQYTGFDDRNGNKIFEGDILSICYEECEETINRVIFSEGAFWLQYKGGETERMEVYDCERATVIGNEWDNPELMEGWTK